MMDLKRNKACLNIGMFIHSSGYFCTRQLEIGFIREICLE